MWAEYCINWMKRREKNVLRNEEKRHLAESKIKDKDVNIDFFIKLKNINFINHNFYFHIECQ